MSSSDPPKSCSGFVHDSDSEYSIEYAQTQSPMSPNIPLTTPIASSMNVSGLNLDVGIATAQTSSTCTTQISSEANPQSKFPCDFLLNPGQNPVASQEPFWQSKQPNLNIPSGSQVHVCHEKRADDGKQKKTIGKCYLEWSFGGKSGIDTSSKKVTGRHHPYASKPRTSQASSSREKIMDDEDEKMPPNHSKTNVEPRREHHQIVSSPILKCPSHRGCLNNPRSESKETRLAKLTMSQNVQDRRSNKDG
ncbi:hypothetical protein O181_018767 [Austropuccinia psidii MF-1]|uniref:Uncharacterized protein n=1 Tax=Austropuccinia psidii MF-1 TaxID=1389203 RepID=A0A9Q3GTT5_9BASI|nr:hypothetical protein [Austropuccinia psidii MF-1]